MHWYRTEMPDADTHFKIFKEDSEPSYKVSWHLDTLQPQHLPLENQHAARVPASAARVHVSAPINAAPAGVNRANAPAPANVAEPAVPVNRRRGAKRNKQ